MGSFDKDKKTDPEDPLGARGEADRKQFQTGAQASGGQDPAEEAIDYSKLKPLVPHEYPGWIKGVSIVMLASFCYSLLSFPQYLDAARNLRRGENLYADNRLIEALIAYGRALHAVPSSENVRVSAAIALFKYGGELPCELAMVYLTGIDLSERKWQEITEVMPPKYDSQFKTEKN